MANTDERRKRFAIDLEDKIKELEKQDFALEETKKRIDTAYSKLETGYITLGVTKTRLLEALSNISKKEPDVPGYDDIETAFTTEDTKVQKEKVNTFIERIKHKTEKNLNNAA